MRISSNIRRYLNNMPARDVRGASVSHDRGDSSRGDGVTLRGWSNPDSPRVRMKNGKRWSIRNLKAMVGAVAGAAMGAIPLLGAAGLVTAAIQGDQGRSSRGVITCAVAGLLNVAPIALGMSTPLMYLPAAIVGAVGLASLLKHDAFKQ